MMEMKFRVWDSFNEEMLYIDFNRLCDPKTSDFRITVHEQHLDNKEIDVMQFVGVRGWKRTENTYKTLMGKEIYKSDILELELYGENKYGDYNGRYVVKYFPTHAHYSGVSILDSDIPTISIGFGGSAVKRLEVIGNIYENPELIK